MKQYIHLEITMHHKSQQELLIEANSMLRSAYAIAERDGENTNWEAFRARCMEVLVIQHEVLQGPKIEGASTCTPRTFRLPVFD
jgi:hypothetical protein